MAPAHQQEVELIEGVEEPDEWQDPSEEIKATFHRISKNNPRLKMTVLTLTDDERNDWIELLVQTVFEIANKDWQQYDEVYRASIAKCKETRVLQPKVWSEWRGQRDVRAKLSEMYIYSNINGCIHVLPAPTLVAIVAVKVLRNIQTKNNNDEATILLENLFQFDYLGFAIDNYRPGVKYIATDIPWKVDPNVRQPQLMQHESAQEDSENEESQQTTHNVDKATTQAHVTKQATPNPNTKTAELVKRAIEAKPIFPPSKTVEVRIKRDEALAAVGKLIERISGIYPKGHEAMEDEEYKALNEQLQQVLTEQMVIVLPQEEKNHLAIWAMIEQHHQIIEWTRAAKEDKTEHSWMEEVADQEDSTMAGHDETNEQLLQRIKELEKTISEVFRKTTEIEKSVKTILTFMAMGQKRSYNKAFDDGNGEEDGRA